MPKPSATVEKGSAPGGMRSGRGALGLGARATLAVGLDRCYCQVYRGQQLPEGGRVAREGALRSHDPELLSPGRAPRGGEGVRETARAVDLPLVKDALEAHLVSLRLDIEAERPMLDAPGGDRRELAEVAPHGVGWRDRLRRATLPHGSDQHPPPAPDVEEDDGRADPAHPPLHRRGLGGGGATAGARANGKVGA